MFTCVTKWKFPLGRGRAEVNTAHLLVAFHIHLDLHTYVIDAQLRNRCIYLRILKCTCFIPLLAQRGVACVPVALFLSIKPPLTPESRRKPRKPPLIPVNPCTPQFVVLLVLPGNDSSLSVVSVTVKKSWVSTTGSPAYPHAVRYLAVASYSPIPVVYKPTNSCRIKAHHRIPVTEIVYHVPDSRSTNVLVVSLLTHGRPEDSRTSAKRAVTTQINRVRQYIAEVKDALNSAEVKREDQSLKDNPNADLSRKEFLHLLNLPKVELQIFHGNPLHYHQFIRAFEANVDRVCDDNDLKLSRLMQYTSGSAKEAIRSCQLVGGSSGYAKAISILENRFGNSHLVTERLIRELRFGKQVRLPQDIQQLADDMQNAFLVLSELKTLKEVDSQAVLIEIVARFPNYVQLRWKKYALKAKRADGFIQGLKNSLNSQVKSPVRYNAEIVKLVDNCYAEAVPDSELFMVDRIWYLPHHAVVSEKKPDKLRVVFDCASNFKGKSLNDRCMQGPDMINKLLPVLLRFRQHSIAVQADIEAMYNQVRIPARDRDALRFLWYINGKLRYLRMTSHLFGGVWCAASSAYALRRTITDLPSVIPLVKYAVERSFYVDDCLSSVSSKSDAEIIIRETPRP
ncbi:hypothetical protein BSL78_14788 [Apostichopus japonicus]|uniref:Reverse transcriptase domain-containing protein n=1 Tax=Stichopus japonicus TaxID=307972 RepID=A0A2G8KK03_STIJA|nr:hypothetical protein BSL78_14788 [Apostichopus japonicus]